MCESLGRGGELVWNDLERSKIFNSNWKGNADAMLIAIPLPGYLTINLHFRLLKLTYKKQMVGKEIPPSKTELAIINPM